MVEQDTPRVALITCGAAAFVAALILTLYLNRAWLGDNALVCGAVVAAIFGFYVAIGVARLVVPPVLVIDRTGFRIVTALFPQEVAWTDLEAVEVRVPRPNAFRVTRACSYRVGGRWRGLGTGWRRSPEQLRDLLAAGWRAASDLM